MIQPKLLPFSIALLFSGVFFSCGTTRVIQGLKSQDSQAQPSNLIGGNVLIKKEARIWAWGLIGEPNLNFTEFCPKSEWVWLEYNRKSSDWFYSLVTLGVYNPFRILVLCQSIDSWENGPSLP